MKRLNKKFKVSIANQKLGSGDFKITDRGVYFKIYEKNHELFITWESFIEHCECKRCLEEEDSGTEVKIFE